jgi:molybdenum cofactor guanylyltransferase
MGTNPFTTAAILAGGRSSRMGYDKINLRIGGLSVLDSTIDTLRLEFPSIIVVANQAERTPAPGVTLVKDEFVGLGPLAGIHAALKQADSEYVYIMACDMPEISLDYIRHLKALLSRQGADSIHGMTGSRPEPFQAFYARRILPVVEQQLKDGQTRLSDLISRLDCLLVAEADVRALCPDHSLFVNINTADDLESYRQRLESRSGR